MSVSERDYLSIGEVLNLLQAEFPDVTISKIRFLESQGLIEPERTHAGYRKFFGSDVERLRFILREQREKYLPLRVIKDRLESPGDGGDQVDEETHEDAVQTPMALAAPVPADVPAPAPAEPAPVAPDDAAVGPVAEPSAPGTYTLDELAAAGGVEPAVVRDLDAYGLVASRLVGGTTYYDDDALAVVRVAEVFSRHGIEPRHLRMHKTFVEREASLYEQIILPLLKQRNPQARAQAAATLHELADCGAALRALLVAHALRALEP